MHGTVFIILHNRSPFLICSILVNITVGKFAAIFYYCYSVCRRFVSKILPRPEIVAIVSTLATSLISYFAKVKFYDWIASHGGWVSYCLILACVIITMADLSIIASCMHSHQGLSVLFFFMVLKVLNDVFLCLIL